MEFYYVMYAPNGGFIKLSKNAEEWLAEKGLVKTPRHHPLLYECYQELGDDFLAEPTMIDKVVNDVRYDLFNAEEVKFQKVRRDLGYYVEVEYGKNVMGCKEILHIERPWIRPFSFQNLKISE